MVTKLIETAVEIEGLLRVLKDGEPSDELYSLLTEKTLWLAEECDRLAGEYEGHKTAPAEAEESQAASEVASDEEEEAEEATAEAYQAPEEQDTEDVAPAVEAQAEEEAEPEEEKQPEEKPHKEEEETHSEEEYSEAYLHMDDDTEEEDEDDDILLDIDDEEDEAPAATADQHKPEHIQKPKPNLKAFFSLNDRFLYARELFDGDMKMFDATLRQLEGIEYFSDIEDYFFNELEWDPERRFVSQYMDTLRPHFK